MTDKDFRPLLVELATGVWRLRTKVEAGTQDPDRLLKSLARQLDSLNDALTEAGVVVQSHTGERFDAGQSVEVVAYAPSAAVRHETVTETITPTVYLDGKLAQLGQIVVAIPEVQP
ncbi:hypothetical protein [Nocardia stercoris]|uniref:Nucleotide exchange factor GrpE n=1 Tax=Nocardia stercoris TaxID=2483361 RepID=A0A3M2KVB3_9NOCA|nr:hypothetical protein [Nocardia stercoris]RMI29111.1 hypothetical protein EBN03_27140 [Nocardia stercoris]